MKRLLTILIVLGVSLYGYSQTEHAKFMGIPIDGTITQFQQKLQAKGIKYNQQVSRMVQNGYRIFYGKHEGENARITAMYNVNTKIVYAVGVVHEYKSAEAAIDKFSKISDSLNNKYVFDNEESGNGRMRFLIPSQDYSRAVGSVVVFCDYDYGTFNTYVQYSDYANTILNDENQ